MALPPRRTQLRIRHLMILIAVVGLGFATWADSRNPAPGSPRKHQWGTIIGSFPWQEATAIDRYSEVMTASPVALAGVLIALAWCWRGRSRGADALR